MEIISFYKFLRKTIKLNGGLFGISILQQRKIYKEWKAQLNSGLFPIDMELPWITIIAKNYLKNYLNKKQISEVRVFEYGSGGSSLFFLKYASEVYSVEHDAGWFEMVDKKIKEKKIKGWTGVLALPKLDKDAEKSKLAAGNPSHYYTSADVFSNFTFKEYVTAIDKFPNGYFDIVLIDGRSRPSCLLHSIKKVKKGGLLILDNAERDYYAPKNIVDPKEYDLIMAANSALICCQQFTQTNIYLKK